jgi:hypothetical protein
MKPLEQIMQEEKASAKRQSKIWSAITLASLGMAVTGYFIDNNFIAGFGGSMTGYSSVFVLGKYLSYRNYKT